MTYDVYRYIFIGAAILCGIMFVVSVLVFIFLNIPKVISDLSGVTAKRAIKQIREQNEASGDKSYKVSAFNEARGKLTDKISPSGNVIAQYQAQMRGIDTTKIATQELSGEQSSETTVLGASAETSVLGASAETSVLGASAETSVLGGAETSVLTSEPVTQMPEPAAMGETAVLSAEPAELGQTSALSQSDAVDTTFSVDYEITYVHSDEIITLEAVG